MFRRGSYLRKTSNAGATEVEVADVTPFTPGGRVSFIHAPTVRIGPSSPATEYAVIERIIAPGGVQQPDLQDRGGLLMVTEPLPVQFLGIENAQPEPVHYPSLISDFVGVLSGDPEKDYYQPNVAYLKSLFGDAFVDYVIMDPTPLPFVNTLREAVAGPPNLKEETHGYAWRWFRHYAYNNHQFVFGSREGDSHSQGARGITRAFDGNSYSHVMVDRILGVFGSTSSRRLLGEVTAHEVAHQWHVNRVSSHTIGGEHCDDFKDYHEPSKFCVMRASYQSAGTTLPEFYDDVVRFHYVRDSSGVDSEYRWVRERCDPVRAFYPQPATPFDWWTTPPSPCR